MKHGDNFSPLDYLKVAVYTNLPVTLIGLKKIKQYIFIENYLKCSKLRKPLNNGRERTFIKTPPTHWFQIYMPITSHVIVLI